MEEVIRRITEIRNSYSSGTRTPLEDKPETAQAP